MDRQAGGYAKKQIKQNGNCRIQLVNMWLFTPKFFQLFIRWRKNIIIKLGKGTGEEDNITKDPNLEERKGRRRDLRQYFVLIFMLDTHLIGDRLGDWGLEREHRTAVADSASGDACPPGQEGQKPVRRGQ